MLHLLLVTDSDRIRRRIAGQLPDDLELVPARSGEDAVEVIGRSSRLDAILVAREFLEIPENDLVDDPAVPLDKRRLRLDQGLAIAALIRSEVPGSLPIALLETRSDEIPKNLAALAWPREAITSGGIPALLERLLSGSGQTTV